MEKMKNKSYFTLFSLIFIFGISHIYAVSERSLTELRPLVASFFYCFDIEQGIKKPGIIYYRKFFNQYSSDLYNSEFYRNRDKDADLIKKIKQKAHDQAIQAIEKKHFLVRKQIMQSSGYEGYAGQLSVERE